MKKNKFNLKDFFKNLFHEDEFDFEDEHKANVNAQIAIAVSGGVYIAFLLLILLKKTNCTYAEYGILVSFYVAAVLIDLITYPFLLKHHPGAIKYFLMSTLFIAGISLQAYTQILTALFLSFQILLACRYRDKRFMIWVIITSFLAVPIKEVISYYIGAYDLNVISILDGTYIINGSNIRESMIGRLKLETYFEDVMLFSVIPQWVQLSVITVIATLLGNDGRTLHRHEKDYIRKEAIMEGELDNARKIQMAFLPKQFKKSEGFDLRAMSVPAKDVGGDFYDFFMIDNRHLAIVIADVSGKGMSAALFMASTKISIRDHVKLGLSVEEVFHRVNNAFCEGNAQGMFVTAWLGILDISTGILDYVNGGHNAPLLYREGGTFEYLKMDKNIIMGAFENYNYVSSSIKLNPSDTLFLYTDGVTESHNEKSELFGEQHLKDFLNEHIGASCNDLVESVYSEITSYAGNTPQYDDITMMALSYKIVEETIDSKTFDARVEEFPKVKDFLTSKLPSLGVNESLLKKILVAADELFSNVAFYAYPNHDGSVEIRIILCQNELTISFIDNGTPFNPLIKKDENITGSVDERKIGGLGITMVKKMMGSVTYSYVENKNIVSIINKLD